jgi:hypothetical protein
MLLHFGSTAEGHTLGDQSVAAHNALTRDTLARRTALWDGQPQAAQALGVSQSWVSEAVAFATLLPPADLQALRAGQLTKQKALPLIGRTGGDAKGGANRPGR